MVFANSVDAEPLEELQLLEFLKYTDASGVTRDLTIAQYNGRLFVIDDAIPAGTVYVVGEKFIEFDNVGAKKPSEMARDPFTNGGSDTFGKPDFGTINNINQPSGGAFNPLDAINNMDNKVQGNDGFAPPTGMSFGGDNNSTPSGNQAPVGASSSLVAFLDKMSSPVIPGISILTPNQH